jgi:hypothetical protein
LNEWIKEKHAEVTSPLPSDLAGVRKAIADHNDYKQNQKPPKAAEKLALEALFNSIQLKLKTNNRPPYVPEDGLSPSVILFKIKNANMTYRIP